MTAAMLNLEMLDGVQLQRGKVIARCPACAEVGMDRAGTHLMVLPDGRFGCVLNPGKAGEEHRRRIWLLAGVREEAAVRHVAPPRPKLHRQRAGHVFLPCGPLPSPKWPAWPNSEAGPHLPAWKSLLEGAY